MQATTFRKVALGMAVLLMFSVAGAQQWQFVGTRAMGMGGAGVATAFGPDAQYWNPAGLAQEEDTNETGLLINAGVSFEATKNVLEGVRDLTDMSDQYKALENAISGNQIANAENISTLFKGLNDISKMLGKDTGALVNADGGVVFKFKNFAVSGRALGTGAITPVVDTKNIRFNTGSGLVLGDTSSPGSASNQSAAVALAASLDVNGVFTALNSLFNNAYADSTALANAIVNAAVAQGASEAQILDMLGVATSNMGGAAEIINMAASAEGSYKDNETLVMADAATFGEMSLGYGQQVIPGLKVGGNFKVISGYTAQSGVMVLTENEDIKDILDKAYDNKKNSTNIGIDLGVMGNLSQLLDKELFWNPQVGLTARNLNSPKFDRPDAPADINAAIARNWRTDKYELKPQVRLGAAVNPFKWMTAAADIDVTENDTMIDSIKSRQLALGLEFNVVNGQRFNMPIRVGYNKNLAESSVSPFYTAGIGFNMMHFYIELAGAISTKTTKIDDTSVPNSAAASLTLGFLF
ncbi:MAG: conjugal transfer protein TraF [Elusimicrobiaceae bacterium]|nr:conjugal transfer protein TraF [Elusimicrobiaceae bacterium]